MDLNEVGEMLKAEREKQGLTLEKIAEKTKISQASLAALEEGNQEALPHPVYIRGFVRNYSRLLGLDTENICKGLRLGKEDDEDEGRPRRLTVAGNVTQDITITPREEKQQKSSFTTLLVSLLVFAIIGAGVWLALSPTDEVATAPETAQEESADTEAAQSPDESLTEEPALGPEPEPEPELPASAETLPEPEPEPRPRAVAPETPATEATEPPSTTAATPLADKTFVIEAFEPCWMEVMIDGGPLEEYFLEPGDALTIGYAESLFVRLGNAGGVRVSLNGEPLDLQARSGQVRTLRFP